MSSSQTDRGQWATRIGFLLACAGSAVGLGNIWKFPYITGHNGGGLFVLIYLACIVFVGAPIMVCEFIVGRSTQSSPVEAFRRLSSRSGPWQLVGWLGVLAGFTILSYYSVVAGWAMHYVWLSVSGFAGAGDPGAIAGLFGAVYSSAPLNVGWHLVFMLLTVGIVFGGVQKGIERASRLLMPVLFLLMAVMLVRALFMPGFGEAFRFVFAPDPSKLTRAGVLEALGHSFFTLSLGMGAMLTYASYLPRDHDIVKSSFAVAVMDTVIALMACLVMYPIIFSFDMDPQAGPGLVFKSMPVVFSQMAGGGLLSVMFFLLLTFAALTSAISLLEVVTAFFVDTLGWKRRGAVLVPGAVIFLFGVPSALSGSSISDFTLLGERNFFDTMDYLASNWFLPLGGLFTALFVGWRVDPKLVREEFAGGSPWGGLFYSWFWMVRWLCPVAVSAVFLHLVGVW